MGRLLALVRPVLAAVLVVAVQAGVPARAADTGSLTGSVFFDSDADGVHDPGESPLDGDEQAQVGVCADHATLPPPAGHKCTYADGSWSIAGLAPGTWTVTIRQGSYQGWRQTAGGHVVQATAGSTTQVAELGTVAPVGSVAGVVWNDHDGDGMREAGEPGIAGAQVYVNDGAEGGFTYTSDASGRYRAPYVRNDRDVLVRVDDAPGDLPPTSPPGAGVTVRTAFDTTTVQDFGFDGETPPTAPAPEVAPAAPITVPTSPGSPRRVRAHGVDDGVRVQWTPPSRTGGIAVTGYEVRVARHRHGAGRALDALRARLLVTGLEEGHRYWVRVRALNAVGHGDWSARRAVRPG